MSQIFERDVDGNWKPKDMSRTFTLQATYETPFTSSAMKRKVRAKAARVFSPIRRLPSARYTPRRDGYTIQTSDYLNNTGNKDYLSNMVTLIDRPVSIGEKAKRLNEQYPDDTGADIYARELDDQMTALKFDHELASLGNQESAPETTGDASSADTIRGLSRFINYDPSTNYFTDTTNPVPAAVQTPTGSIVTAAAVSSFTQANIRSMVKSVRDARRQNGKWTLFCTSAMLQRITELGIMDKENTSASSLPLRRYTAELGTKELNLEGFTTIRTEFGTITMVIDDLLPTGITLLPYSAVAGLLVDMNFVQIGLEKNPTWEPLAKTGHAENTLLSMIFTLECLNPQAHGSWRLS